ncbi:MAG TPA: MFS transporter, partial [Coxiellaceae bacterium]|nr:MFS transporter [Coxiellaceae bacterium]
VLVTSSIIGVLLIPLYWFCIRENSSSSSSYQGHAIKDLLIGWMGMFRSPQMWLSGLIGCMLYLSLSAFGEIWGIPYLNSFKGIDHNLAARLNSLIFFGWLIGSPISGWLSDYLKSRRIPMIAGSLLAAVCISLLLFLEISNPWILAILLFGFGFFCSNEILCFAVARESTPLGQAATAIGFTNMLIMLGGMITQPLVGTVLDWMWNGSYANGIRVYTHADFYHALFVLPIGMLCAAVFAWFLKETYPK